MISIDVVAAVNVRPGDLFAGKFVRDAPTRPVQPFVAAHRIASARSFTSDDGSAQVVFTGTHGLELEPLSRHAQCIVIQGVPA